MMRVPGLAPARRDDLASLLDVFPTVAALAGAETPPSVRGRDLLSAVPAPHALYFSTLATAPVPRHGIATSEHQYVRWEDEGGAHERVYRRGEAAGASEEPDPAAARLLRGRLAQERAAIAPGAPERGEALDPEEIEQLSALGYVAAGDGHR
jgi:arylsulfatase A-like enzyme